MADRRILISRVRDERLRRGWSQDDLARRTGLSRAGVSAIETDRLVPSTAAALALAAAFGCRVEDLFSLPKPAPEGAAWAWEPAAKPARYWMAEVRGRVWLYPVESLGLGGPPHDGLASDPDATLLARAEGEEHGAFDPSRTLVMACCDPAVGLLAAELARTEGLRLLPIPRSSRAALELLGHGLVHVAGVHLARADSDAGNAEAVREALGPGYTLARTARWEEGVALGSGLGVGSVAEAVRARLEWVGREVGSGARQCLDELMGDRPPPKRQARDHRGVAEAVRAGWAEAGVCLRLAGEEAGLAFLPVRQEDYDLCFPTPLRDDPRIEALIRALRSTSYRRALGELPGYDSKETGELRKADA